MNSIQPVMLQPNTQPALNANEQRVVEASDTEYSLHSRPSQAQGVKGCVLLTSERVVWTAADPHVVYEEHGKLGIPLYCVCDPKEEGGGWGLWADPCKITFTIKPMYENSQQPEKITLSFGGKEDRDRVFRQLTRALHDKTWQPAPAVGVPAAAPPVQRAAPVAATPPAVAEPAPPPADPDGIFVVLPHAAEGPLGGGEAATVPVCPPRCGFEYDFTVERKYVDSSR